MKANLTVIALALLVCSIGCVSTPVHNDGTPVLDLSMTGKDCWCQYLRIQPNGQYVARKAHRSFREGDGSDHGSFTRAGVVDIDVVRQYVNELRALGFMRISHELAQAELKDKHGVWIVADGFHYSINIRLNDTVFNYDHNGIGVLASEYPGPVLGVVTESLTPGYELFGILWEKGNPKQAEPRPEPYR
jgi:hypothetical protein